MQRSASRERAFLLLFEHLFSDYSLEKILDVKSKILDDDYVLDHFSREIFNGVVLNELKIDKVIEVFAKKWDKSRLSRVTLCILRIALYEIMFRRDIPNNVSASEAVLLAKKYGTDQEYIFVNGILGSVCSKYEQEIGCQCEVVDAVS